MKTKRVWDRVWSFTICVLLIFNTVFSGYPFFAIAEKGEELIDAITDIKLSDSDDDGYYEIATADELYAYANLVNSGHTEINGKLIANIEEINNWTPIGNAGTQFIGAFDGNGKTVSGLINGNHKENNIGLFGYVGKGGSVKNVSVLESRLNGYNMVGGVVGENHGTVENCNTSGSITSEWNYETETEGDVAGGVVGHNSGVVINCSNTGSVFGIDFIGGVVGQNFGIVTNCYNTGSVIGIMDIGGVVGVNFGAITNCYSTGIVSGSSGVGGVVGYNHSNILKNCYYLSGAAEHGCGNYDCNDVVSISPEELFSGKIAYKLNLGVTDGTQAWYQTVGENHPAFSGDTVYASGVCSQDNVIYNNNSGFLVHDYDVLENTENGFCCCGLYQKADWNQIEEVYEIANAGQLYWFAMMVNSGNITIDGKLTADIAVNKNVPVNADDAFGTDFRSWCPIGSSGAQYGGMFDGNGKIISGLYYDNSDWQYNPYYNTEVGLFGYLSERGTVKNVGITGSCFKGSLDNTGGVVGYNSGVVVNCFNAGMIVSKTGYIFGGVVGCNIGFVENCYNSGKLYGNENIGSVVGSNVGIVENCYFLEGTVDSGNGFNDGTETKMSMEQFASGEVAYLLQSAVKAVDDIVPQIWGQNINNGNTAQTFPCFSNAAVYLITDCKGNVIYSNREESDRHEKDAEIIYTNNSTTHSASYSCCGRDFVINEAHDYTYEAEAHRCICGAVEEFIVILTINGAEHATLSFEYGAVITLPDYIPAVGQVFSGWEAPETMPAENVTLNATLTINSYTVTFTINGEEYEIFTFEYGAIITLPEYISPLGYTFSGWEVPETMPAENVTFNATLTPNSYTVTFTINGEVIEIFTIEYGSIITLPEYTPPLGHMFFGWDVPETMPAEDIILDASLTVNSYTITFTVNGEEYEKKTFAYGETVTAPDYDVETGYTF
ncbi:MAG: hypothetical protein E7616_03860, partial [Ruminococcaceae bacterium]|nr:hypothetical protein [Oscillospiraceae bacterium]